MWSGHKDDNDWYRKYLKWSWILMSPVVVGLGVYAVVTMTFDVPWSDAVLTGVPAVFAGLGLAALGVWVFISSWNQPV